MGSEMCIRDRLRPGHEGVVRWLLTDGGARSGVEMKDKYGRTPLASAASAEQLAVVRLLAEEGVEVNLGMGSSYRDEMRALATILHRVELSCIVSIDVSVHDIPVVRRDELRCS